MNLRRLPRILFISAWDSDDYGAQYLYDGLCDLLGWQQVIEWPFNPYHHRPPLMARQYDADLSWPRQFWDECQIRDLLVQHVIDLVVLSSTRMVALGAYRQLEPWLGNARTGVVLLDMEDATEVNARQAPDVLSPILRAVFKREWRPTDFGLRAPVLPLPFAYPRSRSIPPWTKPSDGPLVFYRAHDWGWPEDSPRHRMVQALRDAFGDRADVGLSKEVGPPGPPPGRLTNTEYHARLAGAQIGVALNAGGGSDNNRYWETVAHGCVLVSDAPRHAIPENFIDGEEACFYETPEQAVEIIRALDADPERRQRIALAGYLKFLRCHSTAARAEYLLRGLIDICIAQGVRPDWVG